MNREPEPVSRTPNRRHRHRRHVDNMTEVLAQMQTSECIHFVKALPRTAIQHPRVRQTAKFALPAQFVEENGDKIEELATLRAQTSTGRSCRSWRVRFNVAATSVVHIIGGWPAFVADNRLKTGDYLIFVLREDARSEFEVHMFRGPNAAPYFPDEGERQSDEDEEEENDSSDSESEEEKTKNQSRLAAPVHQQDEHNEVFTRDSIREGYPHVPRFSKQLVASNIGHPTARVLKSGQFEFPAHFVRNHGERIHESVKLQGVHENSRNYVLTCHRRPRNLVKAYFLPAEWSRFVRENDLKEGQVLQFSLMADSYFVVRKISQTCHSGVRTRRTLRT